MLRPAAKPSDAMLAADLSPDRQLPATGRSLQIGPHLFPKDGSVLRTIKILIDWFTNPPPAPRFCVESGLLATLPSNREIIQVSLLHGASAGTPDRQNNHALTFYCEINPELALALAEMNGSEGGCGSITGNSGRGRERGDATSSGWESIPARCTVPAAAAKGIGA